MTELQMGLLGLGGAAVLIVLLYNKWQEHRHRQIAERVLNTRHTDILLAESTSLPAAGLADTAVEPVRPQTTVNDGPRERVEPVLAFDPPQETAAVLAEVSFAASLAENDQENVLSLDLLSPLIDYIAGFEAVEPVPATQILAAQRTALSRVGKPIRWIGFNERTQAWEQLVDFGDSEYRRLRVGLQLVDRHGPVSDNELSVFHIAMQDLADELMAIVDLPSRQPVIEMAAQLDQFCAGVDIQIGINLISQGMLFPGTKLRSLAEAAGMTLDAQGRFVRCDPEGHVLYLLLNNGTEQATEGFSSESMKTMSTVGVTFLLDVPRVAHGERVFNQMLELARRFAEALQGALVDDNRRPLSEEALEPIRRQVLQYQSAMAARQMPAGGPLALRLFS
jgi:hypothetical protein